MPIFHNSVIGHVRVDRTYKAPRPQLEGDERGLKDLCFRVYYLAEDQVAKAGRLGRLGRSSSLQCYTPPRIIDRYPWSFA